MKRISCGFAALAALLFLCSQAFAEPSGISIGIHFGADEPPGIGSPVNGEAGLLRTVNWNNLNGANGAAADLIADVLGTPVASGASVTWRSNNTWASERDGEDTNDAPPGPD